MKTPLRYQLTQFDCGPTSFTNAIAYLLEREEIAPELPKFISSVTLDRHHGVGAPGGTSRHAMRFLAHWINDCARATGMPLEAVHLRDDDVTLCKGSRALEWLLAGGVIVASCWVSVDHYVLITGADLDDGGEPLRFRVFDPWYEAPEEAFDAEGKLAGTKPDEVVFVDDAPFSHNRIVAARLFHCETRCPFSFVCNTPKELTLLRRTD